MLSYCKMKNLTYSQALKLFADNLDKSYFSRSGFIIDFQEYQLMYNIYSSQIFVLNDIVIMHKFEIDTFFVYSNNEYCFIYMDSDAIHTKTVPDNKEDWFAFSLVHNCTVEDYKNFLKIVEYAS